jgi:hypothetical protein
VLRADDEAETVTCVPDVLPIAKRRNLSEAICEQLDRASDFLSIVAPSRRPDAITRVLRPYLVQSCPP